MQVGNYCLLYVRLRNRLIAHLLERWVESSDLAFIGNVKGDFKRFGCGQLDGTTANINSDVVLVVL
jgi:hypothetical protein